MPHSHTVPPLSLPSTPLASLGDLMHADAGTRRVLAYAAAAAVATVKPTIELADKEFYMFLEPGDGSIDISQLQLSREKTYFEAIVCLDNIVSSLQVSPPKQLPGGASVAVGWVLAKGWGDGPEGCWMFQCKLGGGPRMHVQHASLQFQGGSASCLN